jgi:hypothetical protein
MHYKFGMVIQGYAQEKIGFSFIVRHLAINFKPGPYH